MDNIRPKYKKLRINHDYYKEVIDIQPTQFIRLKSDHRLFYNEFHNMFMGLYMADRFRIGKARALQTKITEETELVTLEKIKNGITNHTTAARSGY